MTHAGATPSEKQVQSETSSLEAQPEAAAPKDKNSKPNMLEAMTPPVPVDRKIQTHLGRTLKASYEELIRQPVPDRFIELLKELEAQEDGK